MRFYFISPFCLLRPTTNRIFDVRFCDLMAGTGAEVTLIYPYYFMKENMDEKDVARNYSPAFPVKFRMLQTRLDDNSSRWWQLLVLLTSFFYVSLKIVFHNRKNPDNVFVLSRDNKSALPMMVLKKVLGKLCRVRIITTVHEVKAGKLNSWMYKNYDGLFVTTMSAKEKLMKKLSISESKIDRLVSPVSQVDYSFSKEEARKKIGYTKTSPLVVYTGKLGKGIKELDYILDAASLLPDYNFILTGGKEETVRYFQEECKSRSIQNITWPGFINDAKSISNFQLAADVLVSYYSKQDHVVEYNFPQKLVEYMHTRNPIVTPDFPATHDIVNASNAIIVEPDNPSSFAEGIRSAVENKDASMKLAEKAFSDVQQFSFENSAQKLIRFFNSL